MNEVFLFLRRNKKNNNEPEAICQHVKGLDGYKARTGKFVLFNSFSFRAIYESDDDDGVKR